MKILFFSTYFYPYLSGLTVYPLRVLQYLSYRHRITILTFNYPKTASRTKLNRLNIVRIPYLFRLSKGFVSPQSLIYFISYLRKNDRLIINLPNFEGFVLALIAKLTGKKIIAIYHCQVSFNDDLLSKIIIRFLNVSVLFQAYLADIIIGNPDYIEYLPIGRYFKHKIKTTLPPIFVAPANLNFYQQLSNLKKNKIWIGFVGRFAREKGIEYLIEALSQLNNKNIELVFAGQAQAVGEDAYFKMINHQLTNHKLSFRFFGKLTNSQLSAFYKRIDLLVIPSINSTESFAMTQAEAIVAGTPVIATNLPGVRLPVQLTKMGIVVQPKNSEQIAEAIQTILNNRKQSASMEKIADAQKIFDPQKTYRFFEKIINS